MTPRKKPQLPPTLLESFETSLQAASWLTKADDAQVEVARILIRHLDTATDSREIVSISKTLTEVLADLGMNVAGRTGKAEAPKEVTPLDAIRKRAAIRLAEAPPRKQASSRKKSTPRSQ